MGTKTLLLLGLLTALPAGAEESVSPVLSVEDNIRTMDRDHDGMVSMSEIRAHLQSLNGKGYRRELLDDMAAKAEAQSCASPFTRSFY